MIRVNKILKTDFANIEKTQIFLQKLRNEAEQYEERKTVKEISNIILKNDPCIQASFIKE